MATNAKDEEDKPTKGAAEDETKETEDEEVETGETQEDESSTDETEEEAEAGDDDGQTDDETEETSKQEESTFTKGEGFDWVKGDSPQEAFDNLKTAYQNSSQEALKWKRRFEEAKQGKKPDTSDDISPIVQQAERRELEAMNKEYDAFLDKYSQSKEPGNAEKLDKRVRSITKAIQEDEDRVPSFAEVLTLAATSFGWKPDTSEQVASAAKGAAASSVSSGTAKPQSKSKVTAAQIKAARRFGDYAGKSDAQIAKELEAYAV